MIDDLCFFDQVVSKSLTHSVLNNMHLFQTFSTISIDSLKRNDPDFTTLNRFFEQHFGRPGSDELSNAKANFVESLAVSVHHVLCNFFLFC